MTYTYFVFNYLIHSIIIQFAIKTGSVLKTYQVQDQESYLMPDDNVVLVHSTPLN